MARREKSIRDRAREADRYREAAELALGQLQWAVDYQHRIRRPNLAAGLETNRQQIVAQLRRIAQQGSEA